MDLIPPYMITDKQVVKEGDRPKWTKKNNLSEVTTSWHNYMKREVVRDFQQTMLHCSESPYEEDAINSIPTEPYEFPTGYNMVSSLFSLFFPFSFLSFLFMLFFKILQEMALYALFFTSWKIAN